MNRQVHFCGERTVAQHFDFVGALGDTGIVKGLYVKRIQTRLLHQQFQTSRG